MVPPLLCIENAACQSKGCLEQPPQDRKGVGPMSFERQVRRRRMRMGAAAGVMTAALAGGLPAASKATAFGYSAPFAPLFPSQSQTAAFQAFKTGIGAQYARIFAPWDAADTYNPSTGQC